MTPYQRAERYLAKVPTATEGNRNDGLNKLGYALMERFELTEADFDRLMLAWAGQCSPPIPEPEALKTIRSAWLAAHRNGAAGSKVRDSYVPPVSNWKASYTPKSAPKQYDLGDSPQSLPKPMEDGARQLIRVCFAPGEGIRIVNARIDEDGSEVPDGAGPCLSREEWLRKLDRAGGNPNSIFSCSKGQGIYIGLNPMKIGGTKDADVTEFRHALVEFDAGLSPMEQWNLYQKSSLPCAAVIYSGGKSVHAWVKIGARDRREYDDRVRALYEHFEGAGYRLDVHNKNPGRLSRLPACVRFGKRQELLALNTGAESWAEWQAQLQAESIGEVMSIEDLDNYDPEADGSLLIGDDWLSRGEGAFLIGPSGIGKSSLAQQIGMSMALGRTVFGGLRPIQPLKVLFIQAENSKRYLKKTQAGIRAGLKVDAFTAEAEYELLNRNMVFVRDLTHYGVGFIDGLRRLIDRHKPDLVIADPLLSFFGDDINKVEVVSQFCRHLLNPLLMASRCAILFVHHTGKPPGDPKNMRNSKLYASYSGLGHSELTNWPRAMLTLQQAGGGVFRLIASKKTFEPGFTHPNSESITDMVWLRHSDGAEKYFWTQIEPPGGAASPRDETETAEEATRTGNGRGRPNKVKFIAGCNLHGVLWKCPAEGESANTIGARLHQFSRKAGNTLGMTKCRTDLLDALVENGKLKYDDEKDLYFKGPNA